MKIVVFALLAVGCQIPIRQLPIGTRVTMTELYDHREDLDAYIQAELDHGHSARAFYALELVKTRPYSVEQLARRDNTGAKLAVGDLRPVFLAMLENSDSSERGLVLAKVEASATQQAKTNDGAFWTHMKQFEQRTAPLNESTTGIPYDYAARFGYGVSTAEETTRLFRRDEGYVSWFVHDQTVTAFVIVRGTLRVHRLEMPASALRERVQALARIVRTPPQPGTEQAWRAPSRELYRALLGPLEHDLAGVRALYVSPHGFLANVPFALLADAQDRLVLEQHRVTYVPSASIYRQLLSRPILNSAPRMLAIGNAVYPAGVVPLEFAGKEAAAVSQMFPGGLLLRREAATETKIDALAPAYNILHFATHGVLLGRTVPGGSSLLVTADDTHDGFLSAAEIAGLDLSHSYIAVLSACETSVAEDDGRSSDLGSITNAFLTAGTPSVLGTMWQVNDETTTLLMLDFYQQFLEVGAGEALRRAQLSIRKNPRFAHPYYWGAFVLYGWDK